MSSPDSYKVFVLPGEPKGSMDGPNYFTPARGFTQPTKAIVLLTDVFGLPMPNPKIVADHLAEHVGVDVWIPDLFNGGLRPYTPRFLQLILLCSPVRQATVQSGGSRAPPARSCWCQNDMDQYGRPPFQVSFRHSQTFCQPPNCC
jgi:hypothetical protein